MTPLPGRWRRQALGCALLALMVFPGAVRVPAQEGQEARETAPAPSADELDALLAQLLERIQAIESTPDLIQATRDRLLEPLVRSRDWLRQTQKFQSDTADFARRGREAPDTLLGIRAELEKPATETDLETLRQLELAELESRLRETQTELASNRKQESEWAAEIERRQRRRSEIPQRATAVQVELEGARGELEAALPEGLSPAEAADLRLRQDSRRRVLETEAALLREELAFYDAARDLVQARRNLARQRAAQAESNTPVLQELVTEIKQRQADATARRARLDALRAHPVAQPIARRNQELAELNIGEKGLVRKIADAQRQRDELRTLERLLSQRLKDLRDSVEVAGLTAEVGRILRRERFQLPDPDGLAGSQRLRQSEIARVGGRELELAERERGLEDVPRRVEATLARVQPALEGSERDELSAMLQQLFERQRQFVDEVRRNDESYLVVLRELDAVTETLEVTSRDFGAFIDENVLWIRSSDLVGGRDVRELLETPSRLFGPSRWRGQGVVLLQGLRTHPAVSSLCVLVLMGLLGMRRRLRRSLLHLGSLATRAQTDSFLLTLRALLWSAGLAVFWPGLVGLAGLALASISDASPEVRAVAYGLQQSAGALLVVELLRVLCLPRGLTEVHLRWRARNVQLIRKYVPLLLALVPVTFLLRASIRLSDLQAAEDPDALVGEASGRLLLLVQLLFSAWVLHRLLRPRGGLVEGIIARSPGSWMARLLWVWFPLAVGVPLLLAAQSALGYHYTALEMTERLRDTIGLILVLILAHSLVLRWSFVGRRRLAVEQARRAREEAEDEAAPQVIGEGGGISVPEPDEVDLRAVDQQTRHLLRALLGFGVVVGLWMVWVEVLPALGIFDQEVWSRSREVVEVVETEEGVRSLTRTEELPITVADLLVAAIILALTIAAGRNLPGLLKIALLKRLPFDPGARYAFKTLVQYAVAVLGVVLAFRSIGLKWGDIQWLVAAMTVGLGFGLQEIFGNLVSGLLLLFERPIRVGDTVSVGGVSGTVSRIRVRATTIIDWDRKELIVPNKDFITGQIVNWSLSDPVLRVILPVGVAYGSDTAKVERILLEVAGRHPHVLADPSPRALFLGFGESSLNFELRVFLPSIEHIIQARHDLHMAVDQVFREEGVEISFPQRDLHLRSSTTRYEIVSRQSAQQEEEGS